MPLSKLKRQKEYVLSEHNFDTITRNFYIKDENRQKVLIDKSKVYRIVCVGYYWYKKFPFTAYDFPNLQSLRVNLQSLYPKTVWPDNLDKFTKLQILSFDYGNPYGEFSTTSEMYISKKVWSLNNLKELTLDMPFAAIPEDICKLKKLQKLTTSSYITPELINKLPISSFVVLDDNHVSNHNKKRYENLKYWFIKKNTSKKVIARPSIWYNQNPITGFNYNAKKFYLPKCYLESNPKNNEYKVYYKQSQHIAISGFFKNAQMDSLWQFYDEDGRIMNYYLYRSTKLIETGFTNPFFRITYSDSLFTKEIPNFMIRCYYTSDSTCIIKSYRDERMNKLYSIKNYTNGLEHGVQIEFDEKEIIESNYVMGTKHGNEVTKDLNGNIVRIVEYKNGEFIKEICRKKECEKYINK